MYIGQTGQKISGSIKQHKYDFVITNKHNENETGLAVHHFNLARSAFQF